MATAQIQTITNRNDIGNEDDERELLITNLFVAAYPFPPRGWLGRLLSGRKLRDVPNAELAGIVANLEAAAARELLVTNLYLAAPDPLPGEEWWDALLGGRAIAAIPTAELAGIVANLEAAGGRPHA